MNNSYDVIILTEDRYEQPSELTPYISNVLLEDALLSNALTNLGLRTARFSWSNPDLDWSKVRSVIFRTTWDYFDRFDEFKIWLEALKNHGVSMFNDYQTILWNRDKSYLEEMRLKGISIPATLFIKKGDIRPLSHHISKLALFKIVLKPNVSGAARHTYLIDALNCDQYEAIYRALIAQEDLMLQEFQKNIQIKGEISLIMIEGKFTHAVLKQGKAGDFRVQDDFGGSVCVYNPNFEEIKFAEHCISVLEAVPIYCRVDLMWDNNDCLVLSELEMIEPELWFRNHPPAAYLLAKALKMKLDH